MNRRWFLLALAAISGGGWTHGGGAPSNPVVMLLESSGNWLWEDNSVVDWT